MQVDQGRIEPPAHLVSRYLQSSFSSHGIETTGIADGSGRALPRLSTRILGFERLLEAGEVAVLVNLEMQVRYASAPSKSWTAQYRARLPAASGTMHDSAAAFGEALDQVLQGFYRDLANK